MSFFCFYGFLSVIKSGPYIRVDNAIFLTDFFRGCPICKASNNPMHRYSDPSHYRLAMTDRGVDNDSLIHPMIPMPLRIYET